MGKRGRPPEGEKLVERLEGTAAAKQRLEVYLLTLGGKLTVSAACARLGIKEAAFYKDRSLFLQEALAALEPKRPGRKPQVVTPEMTQVVVLEKRLKALERELEETKVREMLALAMPHLLPRKKKAAVGPNRAPRPVERGVEAQVNRVEEIMNVRMAKRDLECPGFEAQRARRAVEGEARSQAAAYCQRVVKEGGRKHEAAAALGLARRTLFSWCEERATTGVVLRPRGREATDASLEERWAIRQKLGELGPQVGIRRLGSYFQEVNRRVIKEVLTGYRAERLSAWGRERRRVLWQGAGRVWAMDFSEPPWPVDGIYPEILAGRDLGSGWPLLWEPVSGARAELVLERLAGLFETLGAPLVLKIDNGPVFLAQAFEDYLTAWGVSALFSPPACPRYNGAMEASIRWQKARTFFVAAKHHRPWQWQRQDLAEALAIARETTGRVGERAAAIWEARQPVAAAERQAFLGAVRREELKVLAERARPQEAELDHYQRAAIRRTAVGRALEGHGLLTVRRRVITPPIKSYFGAKIS